MWTREFHQKLEDDYQVMSMTNIIKKHGLLITRNVLNKRMEKFRKKGTLYVCRKKHDFSCVPVIIQNGGGISDIMEATGCSKSTANEQYHLAKETVKATSLIADAPDDIKKLITGLWKNNSSNVFTLHNQ